MEFGKNGFYCYKQGKKIALNENHLEQVIQNDVFKNCTIKVMRKFDIRIVEKENCRL